MNKPLFSRHKLHFVLLASMALFIFNNNASAQCGASVFNEGGTVTPVNGVWNSVAVGSGTYVNVLVNPNNIYSFRYSSNSALLGYEWDMTLSNGSGVMPYNNSLTPIRDSWTGGSCPAPNTRPHSAEWYGTYNGTLVVNTNSWNGACQPFVPGQGSTILQYKECIPSTDPGPGNSVWNVDAFATSDISIPNLNARYGYYTDPNTNFITYNYWPAQSNPSVSSGWVGCEVPNDYFVIRARRTGWQCGVYTITDNSHDDDFEMLINGTVFYSSFGPGAGGNLGDFVLTSTDVIEFRLAGHCGADQCNVSIAGTTLLAVSGGAIGGVVDNSNICEGQPVGNFTNVTSASGGTTAYPNGGTFNYDWQYSTDGGATWTSTGVTTDFYNSAMTIPPGSTYTFRRRATDRCGNFGTSNVITVHGVPSPNGSFSPFSQQICSNGCATLTLNFNPGTGPFSFNFTDGVGNYSRTGKNNGDTIQVCPPTSSTTYNFTSITDANGCNRTSGFSGGAVISYLPPIGVAVVVSNASCFGSSTGSITVNASGGQAPYTYSDDNGVTYQGSNVFSGLSAGSYDIVVKDAMNCTQAYPSNPVVIGQPTPITQTDSSTDASCANVFDGTVSIYASGGTPPYQYSLNGGPPQFNNVFTGIGAGTYTTYVFDANGCLDTSHVTVGNTYIISVAVDSQSNITCFGAGNGCVTVHVNGGIPPYMYSINGSSYQSSGTFCGLNAGTYTVIGRDSKGCTETVNVTISSPTPVSVSVDSITNILCNGSSTGAIYITPSGGTPPYTFMWNPGGAITEDNVGIAAGTYNVLVTDSNGCTGSVGATVTQPFALSLTLAGYQNLSCYHDSTGAIYTDASGGAPPYSFVWSTGDTLQDIFNLAAGTYSVTVTDVNGCTQTLSQTLTEPVQLVATASATGVSCHGAQNGSATVNVSGGTPPYSYLWSTFTSGQNLTGVGGGLYFVVVTDFNGCTARDSVNITEAPQLTLTAVVTNISCAGSSDGVIDITVGGGTLPYSFNWSNGATTEDASNLAGGSYCVTVTDSAGCTISGCWTITEPLPITTNFIVTNAQCAGDSSGGINLIPSGGTPPFTYMWSTGATTEDLSGVPMGTYYVTLTDSRGCSRADSATINGPTPLYTSGIIRHVSCHDACDGEVIVTAYGGTPPYSFLWSTGEQTENVVLQCGGDHYVTVTDAHGCIVISLYIINNPPALTSQTFGTNPTCFGVCNGQVSVAPAGGTTPYSYFWNNFNTDSAQNGVCGGHYVVQIIDSNNCKRYDSVDIVEPADIHIADSITNVPCNGFFTGAIDLTVNGGTPPFTYAWSNGATTEDLSNVGAGTYIVTVTDSHGCTKSASYEITQAAGLFTTVSVNSPLCSGGTGGFILVDVVGGTVPYTYTWNTTPAQHGSSATNLSNGTYAVTITDAHQCSATVQATIQSPDPIVVTTTPVDARCYNTATGMVIASATGGVPPYLWEVNGIVQASDTFAGLPVGTYVITAHDANGCTGSTTFTILSPVPITVDLSAPDHVIAQGMQTQLVAVANSPNSPVINYFWSPNGDSLGYLGVLYHWDGCPDSNNCSNPHVSPLFTTTFTVAAMNADSCFAYDTVTVTVLIDQHEFIPNAMTPNGDGLNDRFEFDILGATNIEISIFDRWGERVYYNANQPNGMNGSNGWDGTNNGKLLPFDTYVWKMKVTYFNGVVKEKNGTVATMR